MTFNPRAPVTRTTKTEDTDLRLDDLEERVVNLELSGGSGIPAAQAILDALKTIDGAGSELDADRLDGLHASSFSQVGHNHAGLYDPSGAADAALASALSADAAVQAAAEANAAVALSNHALDTTAVHGIADTSLLLDQTDIGSLVQPYSSVLAATTASFTTADETKLDGIEAGADVTDAANVAAAIAAAAVAEVTPANDDQILVKDTSNAGAFRAVPFSAFSGSAVGLPAGGAIGQVLAKASSADYDVTWAAPATGGGSGIYPWSAFVYQAGGNTIAVDRSGTIISQGATSAANNASVINAAAAAVAGTYTPGTLTSGGYGGGGTVRLSEHLYQVSSALVFPWGVGLEGSTGFDRNGFTAQAHSFSGTLIQPTAALASKDIDPGAGTTTKRPVLQFGSSTGGSGSQSTTNPHGVVIRNVSIDGRLNTTAQGILLADTQFVHITSVNVANFNGTGGRGIEIVSTNSPDDGAHATMIYDVVIANCQIGVDVNGSGSTDSFLLFSRVLQCSIASIRLGVNGGGGGWQIIGNHFTTGSTSMTGSTDGHVVCDAGPTIITGNYFDTTGGYAVWNATSLCNITGNYIKCAGSKLAPIYLSGNGRQAVVTGNTCQAGGSTRGLVQVSSTSGDAHRPVITGNVLGDGGNTAITGIWIDSAGGSLSETSGAMVVIRSGGGPNPYVYGNRIVISAV